MQEKGIDIALTITTRMKSERSILEPMVAHGLTIQGKVALVESESCHWLIARRILEWAL